MLDYLIRGGTIIDGSGGPEFVGDVGIKDGRIQSVGTSQLSASKTIDATGCVLSPGFIDVHTHYDGQLSWDPLASPSPHHGVTTIISGNCGFTLAPVADDGGEYVMRMMARVEGIPVTALETGLDWNWRSFGEWLSAFEGRIAPNAGFLVGHSTVRRAVMGSHAHNSEVSHAEILTMQELVDVALTDGALGFSTSRAPAHNDGDGMPVPSRCASHEEIVRLSQVVRDHDGTTLELVPNNFASGFTAEDVDLMTAMSAAGGRPINWNVLKVTASTESLVKSQLAASEFAEKRDGCIIALANGEVVKIRVNLASGMLFDALPGWGSTMALPLGERMHALADPNVRQVLRNGAASVEKSDSDVFSSLTDWDEIEVAESFAPSQRELAGSKLGDLCRGTGISAFDMMLDLAIEDHLTTSFSPPPIGNDDESWSLRARTWSDPRVVIGGSDAGAHLDMMCGATATSSFLATAVRERQLLPLNEAIYQLTGAPADLYGLKGRGRVEEGNFADLLIFDADTISPLEAVTVSDLPGGASRLFAKADGIHYVFVNGVPVLVAGQATGNVPGQVLRSGRDTRTVVPSSGLKRLGQRL